MKKKTKILVGIISLLLVLAAAAGGIFWGLSLELIFGDQGVEMNRANIEWYDEEASEFTITTVQELYDLAALSQYYTFEGQTVKLGADLVLNKGQAKDWETQRAKLKWYPIKNFAGTFDGQGHSISGVYGYGIDYAMGFFANTSPTSVIKDFKLVNSYFKSSGEKVGAIAPNGAGTFEKIYTDAIVVSDTYLGTGGFIGVIDSGGEGAVLGSWTKINDCWFDGEVKMTGRHGAYAGGFVGRFTSGTLEFKNCLSSGIVSAETEIRAPQLGGFVGATPTEIGTLVMNLENCLNDTLIDVKRPDCVGAVIGHIMPKCKASFKNCYSTRECYDGDVIRYQNSFTGNVLKLSREEIKGIGGYRWTALDFDNHWSAVQNEIPVLSCFAGESLSLEGVTKAFNIDWYNEYSKELIIDSVEDFYGFQMLPSLQGVTYQNQVVKLACDIVLNKGKASGWSKKAPENMWTPIGSNQAPFKGTFDGQGHSISGIYVKQSARYTGLFAVTAVGSTIKNLRVLNSYFEHTGALTEAADVGSVVARCNGNLDTIYSNAIIVSNGYRNGGIAGDAFIPENSYIRNCWFDGKISLYEKTGKFAGGILGRLNVNQMTIDNCLNTGTIFCEDPKEDDSYGPLPHVGGICGIVQQKDAALTITSCLSVGTIENPSGRNCAAAIIGRALPNTKVILKYNYGTEESSKAMGFTSEATQEGFMVRIAEKLLKGSNGYYYTELDFDKYWVAVKDGTPELKSFSKAATVSVTDKQRVDTDWYLEKGKDFTIDSLEKFLGFAQLMQTYNFKNQTVKLGKDIVLADGFDWKPLGTTTIPFSGTFDGQNHSISKLYVKTDSRFTGLFAITDASSMIKNLKILDSYFEHTGALLEAADIGSVAGRGNGNLENVYSNATIVSNGRRSGGLIGDVFAPQNSKIKNCWFDGSVTLTGSNGKFGGGIVGRHNQYKLLIENCLNTGSITCEDPSTQGGLPHIGGICGLLNGDANLVIRYTMNSGTVKSNGRKTTDGAIIGRPGSAKAALTLFNVYSTTESTERAIGANDLKIPIEGLVFHKAESFFAGANGYKNTELDFNQYWIAIEGDTPQLRSFYTGKAADVSGLTEESRLITSWYDTTPNKTFVLNTLGQFYGFQELSKIYNFATQTIKLGADMHINEGEGDASTWGSNAPDVMWTPIGKQTIEQTTAPNLFAGTFDGDGHTISGIYVKTNARYAGLFGGIAAGGVVRNFKLLNSYFEHTGARYANFDQADIGSIVGRLNGSIDTIYSEAHVVSNGRYAGGLVGDVFVPDNSSIKNCWFNGTVSLKANTGKFGGGIVARVNSGSLLIDNCLNTGTVSCQDPDAANGLPGIGGICGKLEQASVQLTITNCMNTGTVGSSGRKTTDGSVVGWVPTAGQVLNLSKVYSTTESGNRAVGLNSGTINGVSLHKEKSFFSGSNGYQNTELDFAKYWIAIEGDTPQLRSFYTGTEANVADITEESRLAISWYDTTPNKTFTLKTVGQFFGFQELSKNYNFATQTIKLGADMMINEGEGDASTWGTNAPDVMWLPIGKQTIEQTTAPNLFAGTFDGDEHTISGIYVKTNARYAGLFGGIAAGGVVRNFKLLNSYFEHTGARYANFDQADIGSIVGRMNGSIDTIYSKATVVSNGRYAGGMVGDVFVPSNSSIKNCWFDGSVSLKANTGKFGGGIVARVNSGSLLIDNCLNTGTVSCQDPDAANGLPGIGGICGKLEQASVQLTITNCMNTGTVGSSGRTSTDGTIVGWVPTAGQILNLTNVYSTTESGNRPVGLNSATVNGEAVHRAKSFFSGNLVKTNTVLDFTDKKIWLVRENDTPILSAFSQNQ